MKIIFSRKGHDSAAGKIPSPIFPDGTMYSLPIPAGQEPKLSDVKCFDKSLGYIVGQLRKDKRAGDRGAHLDPDLDIQARPRKPGWLPCFGQVGNAQAHLSNQNIGGGDLFLFFGWYRAVIESNGSLIYKPEAKDLHCLFGWLQVGNIYHPGSADNPAPDWASDHPHVRYADDYKKAGNNTLYIAASKLKIPGLKSRIEGGGIFKNHKDSLRLSAPGHNKSIWRLPHFFYPSDSGPLLSFHSDVSRWSKDKRGVLLEAVGRGQEFVLDCDYYPEAFDWLKKLWE